MKQNILLIGGAGFIGSSLVKSFLLSKKYDVFVLEPERANISRLNDFLDKIILLQGDLRDGVRVLQIIEKYKINIVFHLVSTLLPGSTLPHFQNEMSDILIPTMIIMELCADHNIKFVYFSSGGTIYGNNASGIHNENDEYEPISYYGLSKSIVEEMIRFEARHKKLDYLILRPSNPYGPGQNIYGKQGLIAVSIGKVLKEETLEIWGDGNSVRDYIYIDDLVNAIYLLIDNDIKNKIVNIGSGIGYSVNEIIAIIDKYVNKPIKVEYTSNRGVDVDKMILDCSLIHELIDFAPINIELGIQKFLEDIKKNEK